MRINTRIAAAADRSYTRIPIAARTAKECLGADGKLDPALAALAFADNASFVTSAKDNAYSYWVALTFLENLHAAYTQVTEGNPTDCHSEAQNAADRRCVKLQDKGRVCFCRVDISPRAEDCRIRISVNNPLGVVGSAEIEAREYAIACTEIMTSMRGMGLPWMTVETEPADILAEAEERNRRDALRREYGECANRRRNGWFTACSPARFDCPFYKDGKCRYEEEME